MKNCKICGTEYEGDFCPVCQSNQDKKTFSPDSSELLEKEDVSQKESFAINGQTQPHVEEFSNLKAELSKLKEEKERLELENAKLEVERLKAENEKMKSEKEIKIRKKTANNNETGVLQKLSASLPACVFLFFTLLNLIFFATPVAKILGEKVANFYDCLNDDNFILLPNPLKNSVVVLVIEIIALLYGAFFAVLTFLPKFKNKFIKIGRYR